MTLSTFLKKKKKIIIIIINRNVFPVDGAS